MCVCVCVTVLYSRDWHNHPYPPKQHSLWCSQPAGLSVNLGILCVHGISLTFAAWCICKPTWFIMGFPGSATGKEPACQWRLDVRDVDSIPGSGRSSGGGHGNPLQYSFLESPLDKGGWQATVYMVAQSQTQLKWLSMHSCALLWIDDEDFQPR